MLPRIAKLLLLVLGESIAVAAVGESGWEERPDVEMQLAVRWGVEDWHAVATTCGVRVRCCGRWGAG